MFHFFVGNSGELLKMLVRFSRRFFYVLRRRGGLVVPIDSLVRGFLVRRVVLGPLLAFTFRVIVER